MKERESVLRRLTKKVVVVIAGKHHIGRLCYGFIFTLLASSLSCHGSSVFSKLAIWHAPFKQ